MAQTPSLWSSPLRPVGFHSGSWLNVLTSNWPMAVMEFTERYPCGFDQLFVPSYTTLKQ